MSFILPNKELEIPSEHLELIEHVSKGGYGEIWKAKWKGSGGGITVALKRVQVHSVSPSDLQLVISEVGIIIISFMLF